jgi:hypothetical protein
MTSLEFSYGDFNFEIKENKEEGIVFINKRDRFGSYGYINRVIQQLGIKRLAIPKLIEALRKIETYEITCETNCETTCQINNEEG